MDDMNEAIETLKGYCAKFKCCKNGCRFYDDESGCKFQNQLPPVEWNFKSKESEE